MLPFFVLTVHLCELISKNDLWLVNCQHEDQCCKHSGKLFEHVVDSFLIYEKDICMHCAVVRYTQKKNVFARRSHTV